MAEELQSAVRRLFDAFDKLDFDATREMIGSEPQGVDELSRRWMRSRDDLVTYLRQLEPVLSNVRSELTDVDERVLDGVGIVTCWLEQDYSLEGKPQHVSAPTTVLLRREGGEWKVVLLHTIPLPEQS
jgi:hypothetical protein